MILSQRIAEQNLYERGVNFQNERRAHAEDRSGGEGAAGVMPYDISRHLKGRNNKLLFEVSRISLWTGRIM